MAKVKANQKWLEGGGIVCKDIGRVPFVGEEFIVDEERAKELVSKGRTEIVCAVDEFEGKTDKEISDTQKEWTEELIPKAEKKVKKKKA